MLMPSDKLSGLLLHKDPPDGAGNVPALPEAPPAPPPMQRVSAQHNPYDFITNPAAPQKKGLLPGGNSKIGRLILFGAGALVLITLALVVVAILNSGGTALKADYTDLAQQQTELIRVSGIGVTKARQAEAKNLAITTQYTLASQQPGTLALAKKAGASTDAKTLALGKDAQTDAALTSADQANQFDEVFTKALREGLQKYQQTLKKIYDAASSSSARDTLSKDYNAIDVLLGNKAEE